MFINNLDEWIECALSKFADDTKLGEWQQDLQRLQIWVERIPKRLNKDNCRVLQLGRNNPKYQHRLRAMKHPIPP